ncbi:MAG: LEA type 2 family protein [Chitinophagaceae bacterium]|nr:LEA type 2 family protein [Chitinophagaceae bacterium]
MQKWVNLLLLAALAIGCKAPEAPVVKGMENMRVVQLAADSIFLDVQLRINNPNRFAIKVLEAEARCLAGQQHIGQARLAAAFDLPAAADTLLPVQLHLSTRYLLSNSLNLLLNPAPLPYQLEGTVLAAAKGIRKRIPLLQAGQISRQQLKQMLDN